MSLILAKCIEFTEERKICIAEENGKKYQLNNMSGIIIRKVRVDKCLGQEVGEKRCDFLMETQEMKRVFFIELKGGDLNRALNQIHSTILYLKSEFKNYRIDARIVSSRDVPSLKINADYRKLAKEVLPTKGTIERGTNNIYIESI
ncbi:MAG: hypothetical protein M3Z92_00515 [Bacteroidota bacterium]|nr:hypothetical protein [Bacteroidota bacterium]